MPDTDPFTAVYDRLYTILTGFEDWAALFHSRMKVQFKRTTPPGTLKLNATPGESPAVYLTQGTFAMRPWGRNSLSVGITQTYPIVYVGKVHDLSVVNVNEMKWQCLRALAAAGSGLGLSQLVTDINVTDGADALPGFESIGTEGAEMPGLRWQTLINIQTDMTIAKAHVASGQVPT